MTTTSTMLFIGGPKNGEYYDIPDDRFALIFPEVPDINAAWAPSTLGSLDLEMTHHVYSKRKYGPKYIMLYDGIDWHEGRMLLFQYLVEKHL